MFHGVLFSPIELLLFSVLFIAAVALAWVVGILVSRTINVGNLNIGLISTGLIGSGFIGFYFLNRVYSYLCNDLDVRAKVSLETLSSFYNALIFFYCIFVFLLFAALIEQKKRQNLS